jgi:23S rRNA (cytosine1962-C5)-methyltransferase
MSGLVIKPRSRLLHGHDWVYSSDVLKAFGNPRDGDVVSLKDGKDRMLGSAIYNAKSQIVARRFSRQRQDLDLDFFKRRIAQAVEYRARRGVNPLLCRLVWSESDGLPGVIVDRYEKTLVLQTLTLAMDQRLPLIVEALREVANCSTIIERNDAPIRRAEGLELRTGVLFGEAHPIEITALGLKFEVDPMRGHKTGFYLDQTDNYREVASWVAGKRVLDCFSNQGAFALACAQAGASEVTAVEISADAVSQINANAARNGLSLNAIEANVFDFLKQKEAGGAQFDLVILDPPSFTKSKDKLHDALRGYKEIHLRALKLLAPGGLLATFSCSHHVSAELFKQVIMDALVDAKKSARQLKTFQQSADHPILVSIPETEYLKGYLLELAPGR